jgi:bacteriophage HK97-gp10 putative tail-component
MANVRITVYDQRARADAYRASTEGRAQIAHQAADIARDRAPVDTGEYRDGIGVEVAGDSVRIVDNDDESVYKEYGTEDTPAHATLTDAARQFGRYSGFQPKGGR